MKRTRRLVALLFLAAASAFAQDWQQIAYFWGPLDGGTAESGGTVSSVGVAVPLEFTLSGSPVTSVGTISLAWASQNANLVLASPNGAPGILSMRQLVAADCPTCGGGSGYLTIKDETTAQTQRTILTFLGAGVTCVDNAGNTATECTIPSGGGAPTDVDYLVGTASGGLSAEIVVGATPGGELGGTWASPTIDDAISITNMTLVTPILGTPQSGTLTNTTGFPTGQLAGAGAGVLTFLATPSSANLKTAVTDETGSGGVLVFATSPALTTPNLITATATSGLTVNNTTVGPGFIDVLEDADNGTNRVRLLGVASTADIDVTLPAAAGTIRTGADKLSAFAATTSAELAGVLSDEAGSGGTFVLSTGAALTTPNLIGATTSNGSTGPGYIDFLEDTDNGGNRVRLIGPASTADVDITLPASTGTVVTSTTLKYVKSITVESPTSAEKIAMFNTSLAGTITRVRAVVAGSTPSVTYNVTYGTDFSAAGTNVTTSPSAVTNTTTGVNATLNNTAIPADGYVWFITTAQSGTVGQINVTVEFTVP